MAPIFSESPASLYLKGELHNPELIIGIVSAIGTNKDIVTDLLATGIGGYGYEVKKIRVSTLIQSNSPKDDYSRVKNLMEAGDILREKSGLNSILSAGVAREIRLTRNGDNQGEELFPKKRAYIIDSLKHPDEVEFLRKIYRSAFFLLGIHAEETRRFDFLKRVRHMTDAQATEVMKIDQEEADDFGQKTRDTFHLSDFFITLENDTDHVRHTLDRFLELVFSNPHSNPTFDEFAMFMAFCSSIRSGDLSRQVGAIISRNEQIISTGANECPSFGGGHYWAQMQKTGEVTDVRDGKDYKRGHDSNKSEQHKIVQSILKDAEDIISDSDIPKLKAILEKSPIGDLTEFGRIVHAEMDALMSCARLGIAAREATLYCTTFPCHNCAKHIIDAGIERVVYVEPYPKSKALELHSDSIELKKSSQKESDMKQVDKVIFEPFTGVGARRFLDLFSMRLGEGNKLKRKESTGKAIAWNREKGSLRISVLPSSYFDVEKEAAAMFEKHQNLMQAIKPSGAKKKVQKPVEKKLNAKKRGKGGAESVRFNPSNSGKNNRIP